MGTTGSVGHVTWVDLGTPSIDDAKQFYGRLLGWRFVTHDYDEGSYTTASIATGPVGGMMAMPAELREAGVPPMWSVIFASADLDADVRRVAELGGTITQEPFSIPEGERLAFATDPAGAMFGLASFQEVGEGALRWEEVGAPCWVECQSRDREASSSFYEQLFGWERSGSDDYSIFEHGGRPAAGLMAMPADVPDMVPSYWLAYWQVADLDAAVGRSADLGGEVIVPPMSVEDARFAVVNDPAGAVLGLLEPGAE